jgi:3-phosphoglycerate kinase
MREYTHLPATVGFVRKHVAQHVKANRPRRSPAISAKLLDAAPRTAERFSEHLRAAKTIVIRHG